MLSSLLSRSRPLLLKSTTATPTRLLSAGSSQHVAETYNSSETFFDFTEANYLSVEKVLSKYPSNYKQSAIIPLLDLAQRQSGGWLPLAAMDKVAKITEQSPMRVYEVASFYTMFNREKVGKYYIQLCGTTPCMICGAQDIKRTISKYLGIGEGETTKDGMFTLREVECMGACANAPMFQLNDNYYESLTPSSTLEIIKYIQREGKEPPMGKWGSLPMNGQVSCEGPLGKTSLFEISDCGIEAAGDSMVERFKGGKVDPKEIKELMGY